ncbi:MAG: hypothetical protein V3W34_14025 [Phycisphaerae bacterium]
MRKKRQSHLDAEGRPLTFAGALKLLPVLVLGAYLMALALGTGKCPWVGLLTLLPLLRAIQVLRPAGAFLCGSVWGVSLYGFAVVPANPVILPGISSLVLLTMIPGLYAFAGAWATRRMGFSPFTLGVGWMLVEFSLRPLALRYGLLTPSQDHLLIGVIGRFFGYIWMTFWVAFASAWLLALLSKTRFRLSRPVFLVGLGEAGRRLWHLIPSRIPSLIVSPSRPRAPPA